MSVRKRQWHTNAQARKFAKHFGVEFGEAKKRLVAAVAEKDAGVLEEYPPKEAWIADFTDGTGKRHIQTFRLKKKAEEYAAKTKTEINAGTHVALDNEMTVAMAAEKWLKRVEANGMRDIGPAERATIRQYRQHVNLHIVPRIGKVRLTKLTRAQVEDFRNGLLEGIGDQHKKLSRALARKVLTSLKSILKVSHCSHLAAGVAIGMKKREERKLEVGRDIPTTAEVKRLIEAAAQDHKLHALLLTATLTGLRASELRGLRWSDVDLKAEELHVRQRADRWGTIGAPKSKESRRKLPLAPDLSVALKQWRLACPKGGNLDLVFPTASGRVQDHKDMLRNVGRVMTAAGIVTKSGQPKYGLHAFRHFFASWCINAKKNGGRELPAKEAQTLLGHSSIVMTLDRYGHLFPSGTDRKELADSTRELLA